jgi:predicted ATPase/DNA-binding SARP family transcriptional activator
MSARGSPLTIRLLGPFELAAGGSAIEVSGLKRRALVALLALHGGRVVAVDRLIEALWAEGEAPADPTNALQHHVTRLRQALGPEALVASPNGYALKAEVDALRFEQLLREGQSALREGEPQRAAQACGEALSLWRGQALIGLSPADWVAGEQRRLEALRLDAFEERFEAMLALGEQATLVPELREALAQNPFRERLWRQLMLALYRAGRQADALEAFQDARRVLSEELGLEPGPELQQLQQAILAQDAAIAAVPSAPRPRGNLPAPLTSFVGREAQLAELDLLLRSQRLVTLIGPPGVGKSRLALEAARALEPDFQGGVWHVDLRRAEVAADVGRLAAAVVEAGSSPATGEPPGRLVQRLRNAEALLVFDECERFAAEVGALATAVLSECPQLRVLATSRQALRVEGEYRLAVEPLALVSDDELTESEAVQLFSERARAARSGFRATARDSELVTEICRLVDGLPAAIELAAARVHVLGLREILAATERRLALFRDHELPGEAGDFLAALVGWSYELLHADEKTLLHQLAVFRGGADLEALLALAVGRELDEPTVTHLLTTLVDKSIVAASFPEGKARYDLLTTVRDYVLERLAESGELAAVRKAHAEYFAMLAAAAWNELRGPDWHSCTRRLELENDNFWVALAYAREAPDAAMAIRLGVSLAWYFVLAARVSEGRRFLELALAATSEDTPVGSRLDLAAFSCYFALEELDFEAAIQTGERALAPPTTSAAIPQLGLLQAALALALAQSGDEARAAALAEEASANLELGGDDWRIATTSALRAMVAARAGDVSTVAAMAARMSSHSEAMGFDAYQVPATLLEAWVAERRRDGEAAVEAYGRALELAGRVGLPDHAAFALARLGSNARAGGDLVQAEELERRALVTAEAAQSAWVAAHARVELALVLAADGDVDTAERLYRNVLEWSEVERPRQAREVLFVTLAGSPGAAALLGLAEIADARGDGAAAEELRGRAALALT